ncbi:hypothetical protein AHF37_07448 [Paragonimus kellicotti]|nr:hypothetical protein AHF37_07448 [Paragonimus kellicotti]
MLCLGFLWSCLVTDIYTKTRVIGIPNCFGFINSLANARFFYLTFSKDDPAFNLRTSSAGIHIAVDQKKQSGICAFAIQIPASKALETLAIYLNWAQVFRSEDRKQNSIDEHPAQVTLSFFYQRTRNQFEKLVDIVITNTRQLPQPVHIPEWPGTITVIYITIRSEADNFVVGRLHLSITITPVYRCLYETYSSQKSVVAVVNQGRSEYALRFHPDYLLCSKRKDNGSKPIGLCIARSLKCDSHYNCPTSKTADRMSDEPTDSSLCNPPVKKKSLNWKLIYSLIAAFLSVMLVFTLAFYVTDCQWTTNVEETRSIATDMDLPIAPPCYDSVEMVSTSPRSICTMCPGSPKPDEYYESPPSYTKDIRDETGVFPTFVHNFYTRHRNHLRSTPLETSAEPTLLRHFTSPGTEFRTEDQHSFESWTDTFDRNDTEHTPTELPTYQDFTQSRAQTDRSESKQPSDTRSDLRSNTR